jgi:hypothetical protein
MQLNIVTLLAHYMVRLYTAITRCLIRLVKLVALYDISLLKYTDLI